MIVRKDYTFVTIVEGEGEMNAVPALVKKWLSHRNFRNFLVECPSVCSYGCGRLKAAHDSSQQMGIEYFVKNALLRKPSAILVILDADDECIKRDKNGAEKLGPELQRRAAKVADGVPVGVVIANRMYESWFMANVFKIRQKGYFPNDAILPGQPIDSLAGHKTRIGSWLKSARGRKYDPKIDMKELTAEIAFTKAARNRSQSFDKLVRELEKLARAARNVRS